MLTRLLIAALLSISLSATAQTPPASNELVAEIVSIPVKGAGVRGDDAQMPVHVFKPTLTQSNAGAGPWPVVIFSHGRAGTLDERASLRNPVLFGHVRYWHAKGYAVVSAVRPGYGDNTAQDPEDHGARWSGGTCTGSPDFSKTAGAATHAMRSAHAWVVEQSWARKERIILVGQSVGGLATVSACGQNWPGVIACINFAGGAGGNPRTSPGASCQAERLGEQLASPAKTTQVPSLWLYAYNDQYWGAEAPKKWHKAHVEAATAAGQKTTAEFFAAPAIDTDGHRLLNAGGRFWSPVLNAWLAKNGF